MPSNFTEHYQLNQWSPGDQVLREDFNADNAKLDAAIAGKVGVITGSYVGTGTVGESGPTVVTFPRKPLVVFIYSNGSPTIAVYGADYCYSLPNSKSLRTVWSENTLSFYDKSSSPSISHQLNSSGQTYSYIAFTET